jgi:hypothetical protein
MTKRVNKLSNKRKGSNNCVKITTMLTVKKARSNIKGEGNIEKGAECGIRIKPLSIYDINNFVVQSNPAKIGNICHAPQVVVPKFKELTKKFYQKFFSSSDVFFFKLGRRHFR